MDDRETLITLSKLQAQVENLMRTVNSNATHSAERDARIEAGVERINGSVAKQDRRIIRLEMAAEEAERHTSERDGVLVQHRDMWAAFRLGKWLVALLMTAIIVEGVAIILMLTTQSFQ